MSRYTGSINRKSRRLHFSILENNKEFLKGKKENTHQDNTEWLTRSCQVMDNNKLKNKN